MKIGLLLEGGAMRGLYTAGVLDELMENNIEVDGIVGVSAGVLFGVNFLSKQKGRVIKYNKKFLKDKRYMGLYSLLTTGNVLAIFGINIILNVFNINIIPGLNLEPTSSNIFIQGLILTLSNPITIVFWGSVLTTKIIEDKFNKKELTIFSVGLVSSTLIFLTFVAVLGTMLSSFIPENISSIMNFFVGTIIIFFGIKMLIKKEK